MKKIYHLSTCTTCQAIIKETALDQKEFEMQDIKFEKISPSQLEYLKQKSGSYEALFSKRAVKYKELGLKNKKLDETDFRNLILGEYTFLKRPVIIIDDNIFIGSEKKNLEALMKAVHVMNEDRHRFGRITDNKPGQR